MSRHPLRFSACLLALWLVGIGTGAAAVADPGRLFFTPTQRAQLEAARARNVTQPAPGQQAASDSAPAPLRYDGVVIRSDGKTTRWIDGKAQRDGAAVSGLKPGQIRADGRVYEPYQVLRPLPPPTGRSGPEGIRTMTNSRGFTLIEMAIVLVIITILIGGLAMPLSAQIQARRIAETNKTLEEAREALIGYAMTHKTLVGNKPYLPCPDSNGDGNEDARTANKCPQQIGFLPWITLGTGAQDAWGNRLLYATNTDVSNDGVGIDSTVTSGPSWNQVCSSHTCTAAIATNLPVVLVSLGPNGWGGHNINGSTLSAPSGPDELENLDGDNIFVSRFPTKPGDPSGEFDDLVAWISYPVLTARICPSPGC